MQSFVFVLAELFPLLRMQTMILIRLHSRQLPDRLHMHLSAIKDKLDGRKGLEGACFFQLFSFMGFEWLIYVKKI